VVGNHNNTIIVVLMSMIVADLTCRKQKKYRSCDIVLRTKDIQRWAQKQGLSLSPWDVRMAIAVAVVSKSINVASVCFASVECNEKNYDIFLVKSRIGGNQFLPSTITEVLEAFDLHAVGWGVLANAQAKQKLNAGKELLYKDADDDDIAAADHGKVQHKVKRKTSSSSTSTSTTQTKTKKIRTAPAQSSDADADDVADAEYDAENNACGMPQEAASGLSAELMSEAVRALGCDPTATAVVHALISRIKCLGNLAGSALRNAAESLNADELLIDKVSMQRSVDCC
jgi:hypothetical protein